MRKDFQQLRRFLDGDDPFMTGGHQTANLRKRERTIPDWAKNDKRVREVLLQSFPKLATDKKQRTQAARWMRAIHLYFRLQYTRRQVAGEMQLSLCTVNSMVRNIQRAAQGRWANGSGRLGLAPIGRPRKTTNSR